MEALYTLNSPPVIPFKNSLQQSGCGVWGRVRRRLGLRQVLQCSSVDLCKTPYDKPKHPRAFRGTVALTVYAYWAPIVGHYDVSLFGQATVITFCRMEATCLI